MCQSWQPRLAVSCQSTASLYWLLTLHGFIYDHYIVNKLIHVKNGDHASLLGLFRMLTVAMNEFHSGLGKPQMLRNVVLLTIGIDPGWRCNSVAYAQECKLDCRGEVKIKNKYYLKMRYKQSINKREKMFHLTCHQRNPNSNHRDWWIPSHPRQSRSHWENNGKHWQWCCAKRIPYTLLAGI